MVRSTFLSAAVAGSLLLAGCARTVNLTHPQGPRFEGRYGTPVAPEPDSARRVRVVTFNIKLSRRIDQAIEVLRTPVLRTADVIALQEMDEVGTDRIARSLGLNFVYFPGIIHPTDHRYFGPAILTRWPIDSAWKLVLPHQGTVRGQRRTATGAIVRIDGVPVRVYAVHLETQTRVTRAQHRDQAAAILADAAAASGPVVVAGDFNSEAIGRFFLRSGYQWPTAGLGRTIALFSWDHIFVRGFATEIPRSAGVVREVNGASDHRPVWASLALRDSAGAVSAPGSSPP
jgi:endonuclease/exonuclease/phosphatase family metal-dependent hydrolase